MLRARLPGLLREHWGLGDSLTVVARPASMNSVVAGVHRGADRYVAKWVPAPLRTALISGAEAAGRVARTGLATGEAVLTLDGTATVDLEAGSMALLREVPGRPLTGEPERDQSVMAATLARVHATNGTDRRRADFFPWIAPDAPGADREPWIRPAITEVRATYAALGRITWGWLHSDPAPEAFRLDDRTGRVGLIDWTGATRGPLLYDVASAVMYLGGPRRAGTFLERYAVAGRLPGHELGEHLATFLRFRAAVQAVYFTGRLGRVAVGVAPFGRSGDARGLRDAERMYRGTWD